MAAHIIIPWYVRLIRPNGLALVEIFNKTKEYLI